MPEKTKYVLLSVARSGTSLLLRTLEHHPDIWMTGEIFHPDPEWHLPAELRTPEQLACRDRNPIEFVDRVLAYDTPKRVVGFKMWQVQNEAACEYVMRNPRIKKIILERPNRLATLSSVRIAQETGIWNIAASARNPYKPPTIPFQPDLLDHHIAVLDKLFATYKERSVGDVLYVTYGDLRSDGIGRVQEFLGVPVMDLSLQMHKLLSRNMLDRFEPADCPRIVEHMTRIGHLDWLEPE